MFGCPSSKQSYFSPSLLERSKATHPLVSLHVAAHSLVVFLPSSSGQIPSCHPAPRQAPFPNNSMSSERNSVNWMGSRSIYTSTYNSLIKHHAGDEYRQTSPSSKLSTWKTCLLLTYGPVSFTIYLKRLILKCCSFMHLIVKVIQEYSSYHFEGETMRLEYSVHLLSLFILLTN